MFRYCPCLLLISGDLQNLGGRMCFNAWGGTVLCGAMMIWLAHFIYIFVVLVFKSCARQFKNKNKNCTIIIIKINTKNIITDSKRLIRMIL